MLVLVTLLVFVIIISATVGFISRQSHEIANKEQEQKAFGVADAGVQYVLWLLSTGGGKTPNELVDLYNTDPGSTTLNRILTANDGDTIGNFSLINFDLDSDGNLSFLSIGKDKSTSESCQTVEAIVSPSTTSGYRLTRWNSRLSNKCEIDENACPSSGHLNLSTEGDYKSGTINGDGCAVAGAMGNYGDVYTFTTTEANQKIYAGVKTVGENAYPGIIIRNSDGQVLPVGSSTQCQSGYLYDSCIPTNAPLGYYTIPNPGNYTIVVSDSEYTGVFPFEYIVGLTKVETPECSSTELTLSTDGQTVNGTLDSSDCIGDDSGNYTDLYTFDGQASQRVQVSMQRTSLDSTNPHIYLKRSDGTLVGEAGTPCDSDSSKACLPHDISQGGSVGLPTTDTYTIVATASGTFPSISSNYSLTLAKVETPGCSSTQLTLRTDGDSVSDTLDENDCLAPDRPSSRADLYTFDGLAGQEVQIVMDANKTANTYPYLYLNRSDGTPVIEGGGGYACDGLSYKACLPLNLATGGITLPADDTYTIVATTYNEYDVTFGYTITLTEYTQPSCDPVQLTLQTSGTTYADSLEQGDCTDGGKYVDLYSFVGTANRKVSVVMLTGGIDTYPLLYLKRSDGTVVAQEGYSCDSQTNKACLPLNVSTGGSVTLPVDDTYTIVATSYNAGSTFGYTITLKDLSPSAPVNDNVNNATLITALPYTTSISTALATSESGYGGCGNIGKTVWYKYVATSSGNMIADTVGSNFDTVLVAYTDANLSSGTYTACNDDYNGMQSQVSFQAQAGTTYYFRAGGYSGASGDLTLGVSAVTCDQSTLILSTNGDTANGTLDSGDCPSMDSSGSYADLYTFGGTAGQKIQIIMQTTANYTYPYLYLKKSDGTIISQGGISCDSSYSKGCIPSNVSSGGYYSLPVNDTYTIVTTSYYPEYFFDFDYSLTLKEYTPPVCDQTTLTLSTGGQTTSDALDIGDCQSDDRNGSYADLYTFNGAAGDQIQVDMDTIPNYYTFPYLYLKKSDGTILAHLSEGDGYWYQMNNTTYYRDYLPFYTADPRTSYALPENGTYTIVATSHDPGATYNYSITLRKTN